MRVNITAQVPPELASLLSISVKVDKRFEVLDEGSPLNITVETFDSTFMIASLQLGELTLAEYKGEPTENITLTIPDEKVNLLLELIR